MFVNVLVGISAIHSRGIAHRDIKPENIMLTEEGKVKIIDFGSAKDVIENISGKGNSSTGRMYYEHFVGTPNYMAPECMHNKASTIKSDTYSLACLFYNMAVGFPPFLGDTDYLIFQAALKGKVLFYDFLFDKDEVDMLTAMLS